MNLRKDADQIIRESIRSVLPDEAVKRVLEGESFKSFLPEEGKLYLVAVGKAAWQMAYTAVSILENKLEQGIVLTKYGHCKGEISRTKCLEGGHPVPDQNSYRGTDAILQMTSGLTEQDRILFLLSGGGSALFEKPLVSEEVMENVTKQLLSCGADITEINTIRKRLSGVKGGRFGKHCEPAKIFSIVLSDVLGDSLDMIASGPAAADNTTCEEAVAIVERYHLDFDESVCILLSKETPKELSNVATVVSGSVRALCEAAKRECELLGYETLVLTDRMDCEAREAGAFLASIARTYENTKKDLAFIAGGETVVHLKGTGKGGRNQELALSAAIKLANISNAAIFSIGSDGTDGPTDAAGGYVDGDTLQRLKKAQVDIYKELDNNNAYYALEQCGGLIKTGPTGTNVNDVAVALLRHK